MVLSIVAHTAKTRGVCAERARTCGSVFVRSIPQGGGRGVCPTGTSFFLQCPRGHPEIPMIPTYLPWVWSCATFVHNAQCAPILDIEWVGGRGVNKW